MRRAAWGAFVAALVTAASASAYDSKCYLADGGACAEGPQAARGRWIGPSDEHRQLFVAGMQSAGLPADLNDTLELTVFTDGTRKATEAGSLPTLIPASLDEVADVQVRRLTAAEFAQLPDFGYSLFDWALGLETCPVDAVDAETCHLFAGHMGALNSNHFVPQSKAFYGHYHALALARAGECKATSVTLGADAARFADVVRDCEKEALLLEAVAQHYLQDAWSSGHMWSRWGSPDRAAFPSLLRGVAVAATAGLIHGARALLKPNLSERVIDVPDALCAPSLGVEWSHPDQGRNAGVGDLYLSELRNDARFATQNTMLTSCAVTGMRAVYAATAQAHGTLGPPVASGLISVDPTSDACFGQRATNFALLRGFGVDLEVVGVPVPVHLGVTPAVAASVVLNSAAALDENESAVIGTQFAFDLILLSAALEFHAVTNPFGTNMASGGIGPLVDIEPNGAYLHSPPAPYVDPALPWAPTPRARTTAPVAALSRTFHRAHAADWCAAFTSEAPTLDALRDRVTTLDDAIAAAVPGSAAHQGLLTTRDAQCAACAEFTARHLRFGTGPGSYDTTREPLCTALNPASPVVYGQGASLAEAALGRCGCRADFSISVRPVSTVRPSGSTSICADVTRGGAPAEGVTVTFSLVSGGGSLAGDVVSTGADGAACTTWTAGTTVGVFSVRAALGPSQGSVSATGALRVQSASASVFGDYRGPLSCTVFDIRLPLASRNYTCEQPRYGLSLGSTVLSSGASGVRFTINLSSINCGVTIRFRPAASGLIDASRHEFSVEEDNRMAAPFDLYRLTGAATVSPAELAFTNFYERANSLGVVQERSECTYRGARE